jgi:preprotein translocase subunit SecA
MNKQRQVIYAERRRVLAGEDLHEQVTHMIDDTVGAYVAGATADGYAEDWDLDQLWSGLRQQLYPVGVTVEELEEEAGSRAGMDADFLKAHLIEDAQRAYEQREQELGAEALRELERMVLLEVIDRKWREHLYEMDYLKDGVGLRAYAQRDPLIEYQREGFDMFNQMLEGVKEEAVGFLFHFQPPQPQEVTGVGAAPVRLRGGQNQAAQRRQQQLLYSAPTIDGEAGRGGQVMVQEAPALGVGTNGSSPSSPDGASSASSRGAGARRSSPGAQAAGKQISPGQVVGSGPSRNAPCPCGSGKKYKRCHGSPTGG